MVEEIKKSSAHELLPKREKNSHKGDNGKVLIIGGSVDYYGAPLLSALAALHSGCDLVYLYVPECNFDVSRSLYPDFIVKKYKGEFLNETAADEIIEFGKDMNCILIGPGIGKEEETISAVLKIIKQLPIATVLDSTAMFALKKVEKFPLAQPILITPHANEFIHLVDRDVVIDENDPKSMILLRSIAMDLHINILLKGPVDFIASDEGIIKKNFTGNAGMTIGGTGDVLCGCAASFMAQKCEAFDAAACAAYFTGKAGDILYKKKGYGFLASEVAEVLPEAISA
ncbi:MAG: NAD(P)H-hydrate dehydratase [Candidatus Gracilibacteria bacterium]|jgi:NAD(P)H-hydrate epimerase